MKYIDISNHAEVLEYYHRGNQILGSLGYTDHSTVHTKLVAQRAADILKAFGYSEEEQELVMIAGFLHAMVVTTTVTFHGGFCLYNGGFAAGITAMAFVPLLEALFTPQEHLRILPVGKGKEK